MGERIHEWFVGLCEDQVSFMTRMFHLDGHVAPVRFPFPSDALQFLLPELLP
jgi:hypothetical protein